jgi:hypothetical protein
LDALLAAHEELNALLTAPAEGAAPTMKIEIADETPDEAVGQTLGRYKLLERVGEGGCGVVYVAEQTEPVRRRVALDAGMTEGSAGWQPAVSPTGSRQRVASPSASAPPNPSQAASPATQQTDSLRYAARVLEGDHSPRLRM